MFHLLKNIMTLFFCDANWLGALSSMYTLMHCNKKNAFESSHELVSYRQFLLIVVVFLM